MNSAHFQGKPFNIIAMQVYALTSNAEETEVEQFYEDLQDLLELITKKDIPFIIGDWNAKGQFLRVLVLEGLVGLHRTIQCQLLQHYWSGHRLALQY